MNIQRGFFEFELMVRLPFSERLPFLRIESQRVFGMPYSDFLLCEFFALMSGMALLSAPLAFRLPLWTRPRTLLWWLDDVA